VTCDTGEVDEFSRFERAGWADRASAYDRLVGRIAAQVVDDLLDAGGVVTGSRVLDLACGPGYAAAQALGRGAVPSGVDLSPAMVELALTRHPDIDFRVADAAQLPFPAGAFDAVVAGFLLHHLADPAAVLIECGRVLRPGGRLAVTVWDRPERARFVGVLLDAITEAGPLAAIDLPRGPDFFAYADEATLVELLTSTGFADVQVRTIAFGHQIASTGELWDGLLDGTVRTSALVLAQPPEVRARIRIAFDRLLAAYRRDGVLQVPVSCRLASGSG
jgi:ubiquinone/menaquinone biosynthesis C-methylase UbiE